MPKPIKGLRQQSLKTERRAARRYRNPTSPLQGVTPELFAEYRKLFGDPRRLAQSASSYHITQYRPRGKFLRPAADFGKTSFSWGDDKKFVFSSQDVDKLRWAIRDDPAEELRMLRVRSRGVTKLRYEPVDRGPFTEMLSRVAKIEGVVAKGKKRILRVLDRVANTRDYREMAAARYAMAEELGRRTEGAFAEKADFFERDPMNIRPKLLIHKYARRFAKLGVGLAALPGVLMDADTAHAAEMPTPKERNYRRFRVRAMARGKKLPATLGEFEEYKRLRSRMTRMVERNKRINARGER